MFKQLPHMGRPVTEGPGYDPSQDGFPTVRPRDAATLIIYRHAAHGLEVLMGERSAKHAFMPNRYVFPGGRVDRDDWRVPVAAPLHPDVAARLQRNATAARARALALAAIRETFEETGLIIGRRLDGPPPANLPRDWQPFFETGHAPALDRLAYLCRAVTPPGRPRRFNARFLALAADQAAGRLMESSELGSLRWIPVAKAHELKIPRITEIVLEALNETPPERMPGGPDAEVPVFKTVRGRHWFGFE
ncbi:MAG: NUDIX domain-containing protein [Sneathiellaceae bacterium]